MDQGPFLLRLTLPDSEHPPGLGEVEKAVMPCRKGRVELGWGSAVGAQLGKPLEKLRSERSLVGGGEHVKEGREGSQLRPECSCRWVWEQTCVGCVCVRAHVLGWQPSTSVAPVGHVLSCPLLFCLILSFSLFQPLALTVPS